MKCTLSDMLRMYCFRRVEESKYDFWINTDEIFRNFVRRQSFSKRRKRKWKFKTLCKIYLIWWMNIKKKSPDGNYKLDPQFINDSIDILLDANVCGYVKNKEEEVNEK